jgi:hypothetical protein
MGGGVIRLLLCAAALLGIGVLVLAAAARLDLRSPLLPSQRVLLPAREFHVVLGAGVEEADALHIAVVGNDGDALQTASLDHVRAEEFPVLRYRFADFPRTLELSLVFRRADAPQDVQVVTIPWPGDGWTTLDLRAVPAWHGEIIELGFAEYATPQIVPPSIAQPPFRLVAAQLWSPSWRGGLAALRTAWLGYTPWALISVSALGPSLATAPTPPLIPFLAIAGLLGFGVVVVTMRWRGGRLLRAGVIAAGLAWAILDLVWLADLSAKHALTEAVYAGKSWVERAQLLPDQDTAAAAEAVKAFLATRSAARRVLVAADSNYTLLRLLYLLLPLDVGPLTEVGDSPLPRDALLLLYQSSAWRYDEARGVLVFGRREIPVVPLYRNGAVQLFQPEHAP